MDVSQKSRNYQSRETVGLNNWPMKVLRHTQVNCEILFSKASPETETTKCKVCSGGRRFFQHVDQHGGKRVCLRVVLTWNRASHTRFADDYKIRNWGGKWITIATFNIDYPGELHWALSSIHTRCIWHFGICNVNTNRSSATQNDW